MTLNLILQALLILGAALIAGSAMRRSTAAARHAVYVSALAAALLLPLVDLAPVAPYSASVFEMPAITVSAIGPATRQPIDWILWLTRTWLAGVAVVVLRFLAGVARAQWLRQTSRLLEAGVREHSAIRVPMLFGWRRPVILLPESARHWPADRRIATIAHERAHAWRLDCWWILIIEAACAVFWFLPLTWIVASFARREAERAADDAVLREGADPAAYASHLLEVAREASSKWELAAGVAMAEPSQLERRIVSVLDASTCREPLSRQMASSVAGGAVLALLLVSGAVTSRAQSAPTGTIRVTVLDVSNARIPDAIVSIEDGSGRVATQVGTDASGEAQINSLPPGDYLIEVRSPGHQIFTKGVRLTASDGASIEAMLRPGKIFETVTVKDGQPAAKSGPPNRIRVGGSMQAAKVISRAPLPVYPPAAKAAREQGSVFLQAVILTDGRVGSLEVLSSPSPHLTEAAVESVKHWLYQPTLLNGNPIEVVTKITVNFTLAQ